MPDVLDNPILEQEGENERPVDRTAGRPEFVEAYLGPAATPSMDDWGKGSVDFNSFEPIPTGLWTLKGPGPERVDPRPPSNVIEVQGPDPVAGEVTGIAIDPAGAADQIIYVATNNGGIWKSIDGGTTFQPKTDSMMSLSMGAIALDPGNSQIVYAGSGNLFDGGHQFQRNAGLYKSIDGGETWSIGDGGFFATALLQTAVTALVCPGPDQVLVATINGLFYSVDSALNFGDNDPKYDNGKPIKTGFINSIIPDFAAPTATFYFVERSVGIFTLTIDGAKKSTVSATNLFATSHITQFDDIALAMGPDSSLYVSVQFNRPPVAPATNITPQYVGLFRKKSGQNNWTAIPAAKTRADQDGAGQTNYDLVVGVDPQDKNRIYIGFQELWRSLDGSTFGSPAISKNKFHYDQHALVFSPKSHWGAGGPPTTMYAGQDGGLARSTDGGTNWTGRNASFSTSLLYGIDIGRGSAANNAVTWGGMQDTGTAGHRSADPGVDWHCSIDGDGGRTAVDPTNPQIVYGFNNQFFIKTTDGGTTWKENRFGQIANGLPQTSGARLRIALDPNGNDPAKRIVYVSVNDGLYRSVNAGLQFTKLPPNAGWGNARQILAIAVAPQDGTRIWIGLMDGTVHHSSNSGQTWDAGLFDPAPRFPPGGTLSRPCADIAVDPSDVNQVAVVYFGESKLSAVIPTQHCFLTKDSGNNWKDISGKRRGDPDGNLPDLPLRSVAFDLSINPSRILVAVDGGVMATDDGGDTWKRYGVGLPVTPCMDIAVDNGTGLIRVGTYGRSAWEFTKPAGPVLYVDANLAFEPAAIGQIRTLTMRLFNPGGASLVINSINRTSGSTDFTIDAPPVFPLTILKNTREKITIRFAPTAAGILTAAFKVDATAPATSVTVQASGLGVSVGKVGPRLAVNANLGFGEVSTGDTALLPVFVQNTGALDLIVSKFERISGSSDFDIVAAALPAIVHIGDTQKYQIEFKPSSNGPLKATFQVTSNATVSTAIVDATGIGSSSSAAVWIIIAVAVAVVVVGGIIIYEETK